MAIPDLKGKWGLVTGAASGLERAMAMAFARQSAKLITSDINPVALAGLFHRHQRCQKMVTGEQQPMTD